jgi:predicted esterase
LRSICNCPRARPLPYFPQVAERIGNERAQASRDALRGLGYRGEWHDYAMPHSECMDEIADLIRWLLRVLA